MTTTTRRAPSFRLIDLGNGYVTLHDRHPDFGPARRRFVACRDGYVREFVRIKSDWEQVCEELSDRGATLRATPDTLAAVIRRELRRRNAAWTREQEG